LLFYLTFMCACTYEGKLGYRWQLLSLEHLNIAFGLFWLIQFVNADLFICAIEL
jgi:hypothetical protein